MVGVAVVVGVGVVGVIGMAMVVEVVGVMVWTWGGCWVEGCKCVNAESVELIRGTLNKGIT